MGWSRLEGTPIWEQVREIMSAPDLVYHDFSHVTGMYADAEALGIAWDEDLDHAILTHDVIISGKHPELSSAHWLAAWRASDFLPPLPKAEELIMTTAGHVPGEDNRLIILDLASILDPERRRAGSERVIAEALKRNPQATRAKVIEGSMGYLQGLSARLKGGNPPEADREILDRLSDAALAGSVTLMQMLRAEEDPEISGILDDLTA